MTKTGKYWILFEQSMNPGDWGTRVLRLFEINTFSIELKKPQGFWIEDFIYDAEIYKGLSLGIIEFWISK